MTQPRKIAAIGIATRVSQESGFELGKAVGYSVKGKTKVSKDTLI